MATSARLATFLQQDYPDAYARMRADAPLELFNEFFPDTVVNQIGFEEPTIAYILRHTQLLPRQLLLILNEALSTGDRGRRLGEAAVGHAAARASRR